MIAPVRIASPPPLKARMLGPRGPFFFFFFFLLFLLDDVRGHSMGSKVCEFQFCVPPFASSSGYLSMRALQHPRETIRRLRISCPLQIDACPITHVGYFCPDRYRSMISSYKGTVSGFHVAFHIGSTDGYVNSGPPGA